MSVEVTTTAEYYKELETENAQLKQQAAELAEALEEIQKGEGAYSQDPFEHCRNAFDNMREIARNALTKYRGGEHV